MSERDTGDTAAPPPAENSVGAAKPARGRPWVPGQSGNPGGRPKTDRHLRANCREGVWEFLSELRSRAKGSLSFDELIRAITVMGAYGGLVTAEKGWEFAMQALASPHINDDMRGRILDLLDGGSAQDPGPAPALRTMPEGVPETETGEEGPMKGMEEQQEAMETDPGTADRDDTGEVPADDRGIF